MIEPVCQGSELLEQIATTHQEPGSMAIWWLGQSGFAIKSHAGLLVIDPYLSEHLTTKYAHTERPHVRMTRSPFRGHELSGVDLILASHKHSDHLDPGTLPDLMASSPNAKLVLPEAIVSHAEQMGLPSSRMIGIDSGRQIHLGSFVVRAVPSAHETIDRDDQGHHLYMGYVVEFDGFRLYHSGDSLAYPGLEPELGAELFDILFLPINGRDPSRGVPGNMTAAEAVDLASEVRPRFVVPHHYDMFTFNTVPVSEFETEARRLPAGVTAKVPRCGERWEIER